MIKVYMMLPGTDRPYSTIGKFLYEDEKNFVICEDVLEKRIPHRNILYTEHVRTPKGAEPAVEPLEHHSAPPTAPAPIQPPTEPTDVMVAFTGATSNIFRIPGIDSSLLQGNKWTPDLAKAVFTNEKVRMILGDFVIKDCIVDGPNITIVTGPSKKSEAAVPGTIPPETARSLEALSRFVKDRKGTPLPVVKPFMRPPADFSMTASPFDQPVSLSSEVINEPSYRPEEEVSEAANS
jgi:hypothetical protein